MIVPSGLISWEGDLAPIPDPTPLPYPSKIDYSSIIYLNSSLLPLLIIWRERKTYAYFEYWILFIILSQFIINVFFSSPDIEHTTKNNDTEDKNHH